MIPLEQLLDAAPAKARAAAKNLINRLQVLANGAQGLLGAARDAAAQSGGVPGAGCALILPGQEKPQKLPSLGNMVKCICTTIGTIEHARLDTGLR